MGSLQKCRIRIKESRAQKFNDSRHFVDDHKKWLAELVKDELKEFDENISLQKIIYDDIYDEFDQW